MKCMLLMRDLFWTILLWHLANKTWHKSLCQAYLSKILSTPNISLWFFAILSEQAQDFRATGTKIRRKMWLQNMKIKLIVLAIVIALILIIVLSVCKGFNCGKWANYSLIRSYVDLCWFDCGSVGMMSTEKLLTVCIKPAVRIQYPSWAGQSYRTMIVVYSPSITWFS